MKIAVVGLWHLGCVTAACLADAGHNVLAYDPNQAMVTQLQLGQSPIFEPELDRLLAKAMAACKLHFSSDQNDLADADIVWITFDTPVDENDIADVRFVTQKVEAIFPQLQNNVLIIISSQLPVGTTRQLQKLAETQWPMKKITFAVISENLRLGKAIEVFTKPDRYIVGLQDDNDKIKIQQLLAFFTTHIIWMSIESAEMTKHALNAFLATSVIFINEIATLCEHVGANAQEVELGLKSEERIGKKAYLRPGSAFGGGTLARDVNYLIQISQEQKLATPLFSALLESNQIHKLWSCRRILEILKNINDKTITTLGLTYKAGTNTLRRSIAIETCEWLSQQGANVIAYDPIVTNLPTHLAKIINLKSTMEQALQGADAVIVTTEWPQFSSLTVDQLLTNVNQPFVFDPNGFLFNTIGNDKRIHYFSVGRH